MYLALASSSRSSTPAPAPPTATAAPAPTCSVNETNTFESCFGSYTLRTNTSRCDTVAADVAEMVDWCLPTCNSTLVDETFSEWSRNASVVMNATCGFDVYDVLSGSQTEVSTTIDVFRVVLVVLASIFGVVLLIASAERICLEVAAHRRRRARVRTRTRDGGSAPPRTSADVALA